MPTARMPPLVVAILVAAPLVALGGTYLIVAGLDPACTAREQQRVPSPDGQSDLVTFAWECEGNPGANIQAALVPAGTPIVTDQPSFLSIGSEADLLPRWSDDSTVELTMPPTGEIYRQEDGFADITVVYR